MYKRSNKAARWRLQVIALCAALLSFSVIGTLAVTTQTHALQPPVAEVPNEPVATVTITSSTSTSTPTAVASPTAVSTPKPQPTAAPTAKPKPVPTQAPIQAPAQPPVTVPAASNQPVFAPTIQASPKSVATKTARHAAASVSAPTPTAIATPTTHTAAPAQPHDNSLLSTIFSTAGVIAMLIIVMVAAGFVLVFARRKQVPGIQHAAPSGQMPASIPLTTPMPSSLPLMTPMPSAIPVSTMPFAETELAPIPIPVQQSYSTQPVETAFQSMPRMPRTQISMPQDGGAAIMRPTPFVPSITEYSPLLNEHILPQPKATAQGYAPNVPSSDFNPLHVDYPQIMDRDRAGKQADPTPFASPNTPALTGGTQPGASAQKVTTGQLAAMMRQAQAGLFSIPDRDAETNSMH